MAYTPRHAEWKDYPDLSTPVDAAALEHIESGVQAAAAVADNAAIDAAAARVSAETAADEAAAAAADAANAAALVQAPADEAIAAIVNNASTATSTALNSTFAGQRADAIGVHTGRVADVKRAKGGRIGTNGKGVIAWRIDHQLDEYRSTIWPILRDRGMPAGLGVVTTAVGDPTHFVEPTTTTWTQLKTTHWEGNEIWCHSATHRDPSPYGTDGGLSAHDEIVASRDTLITNGLNVMGWQMPGVSGVQDPNYSANFNTLEQMESDNGQMLLANYGLIEIDRGAEGARRRLPTEGCFMLGHATIDTMTLVQAKANVDWAVNYKGGVEFMLHPKYIGMPGYMSVADFTALVDYVKTKWDAGELEVLTPSGLAFADPGRTDRMGLLLDTSFEGLAFAGNVLGKWTAANNTTGISVQTTGGHTGSNFIRYTSAAANYLYQPYTYVAESGIQGASFVLEAWVRQAGTAGAATARFYILDNSGANPTFILDKRFTLTSGQGWTKYRVPFCIPQTCTNLLLRVSRFPDANPGDVDVDDVQIYAA